MLQSKSLFFAVCGAACLLTVDAGRSAHAQYSGSAIEWNSGGVVKLRSIKGATASSATGINKAGQIAGDSTIGSNEYATEGSGSGSKAVNLGGLPGATSRWANGINDGGQVVGYSFDDFHEYATEWSGVASPN
jgi:uncharacterized membrane protein